MIAPASTFLFADDPDAKLHLHIVLTAPLDGEAVVVSIETLYPGSKLERHVVLRPGDHPFIDHDSVPAYQFANFFEIEKIEAAIVRGDAKLRENASDQLVIRLLRGLIDSDRTPNHIRQFCRNLAL